MATSFRSSPEIYRSGSIPTWARSVLAASPTASTPRTHAKQVEYIVNDSRTRFFFCQNEGSSNKILVARQNCPSLVKIIVYDAGGYSGSATIRSSPSINCFSAALSTTIQSRGVGRTRACRSRGSRSACIYTSGTTGPAKGAMICHRNVMFHIASADVFCERCGDSTFLPAALSYRRAKVQRLLSARDRELWSTSSRAWMLSPRTRARGFPRRGSSRCRIRRSSVPTSDQMSDATIIGKAAYHAAIAVGRARRDAPSRERRPRGI